MQIIRDFDWYWTSVIIMELFQYVLDPVFLQEVELVESLLILTMINQVDDEELMLLNDTTDVQQDIILAFESYVHEVTDFRSIIRFVCKDAVYDGVGERIDIFG